MPPLRESEEPFDFKPQPKDFGVPVQRQDVWKKTESPGVEVNQDGKLRTNIPHTPE
jgi:hypothetical protein